MLNNPVKKKTKLTQRGASQKALLAKYYRLLVVAAIATSSAVQLVLPAIADTPAGTQIRNTGSLSFTDPVNPNTPTVVTSNEVTMTVAEITGITVTPAGITEAPIGVTGEGPNQGDTAINTGDVVYYDYTLTNVGNDPTRFFVPGAPSQLIGGTQQGQLQIIEVDPDGSGPGAPTPVAVNVPASGGATDTLLPNGSIPVGGTVKVRVPVKVTAPNPNDPVTVVLGDTPVPPNPSNQNQPYVAGTNDVYTQDNPNGTPGETAGDPVNGDATNHRQEASASQNATVVATSADLSLTKTVDKATPRVGENVTFTITLNNSGPSNATGVEVTDQLPSGYTFVSATPSQGTYDNTTGLWTVGTVNKNSNVTLAVVATVNATGPYGNTAEITKTNDPDPDSTPNNNDPNEDDQSTVTPTPVATADVSLTKTVDKAAPNVGENVTFTITVNNSGPNNATGVEVTEQLPSGYTFVSATPSQGTYDNTTGLWTVGTVNGNANATLTVVATVNATGTYSNTAQVTKTNEPDPDSTPNNNVPDEDDQSTVTPTPVTSADLSLTKTVDNPTPTVGSNVTFTVTLNNSGPNNATGVQVAEQLPSGYTFVSATPSAGTTYDNTTGLWSVGTVNSGSSATLTVVATVNATGTYGNTAQVTAVNEPDPDSTPNNNVPTEDDQSTVTPTPRVSADLSLTKTVDNPTPDVGQNVTFTIALGNGGPNNATGVEVTEQLPGGYTFVSATPSQGTYDNTTGLWSVGTVNNGSNATLTVVATVNATGPYGNTAEVTKTNEPDPDSTPNNNNPNEDDQATETPTPVANPGLVLVKRITAINGTPINGFVEDPNTTDDNDPKWPANYLNGAIDAGAVQPGDAVEYTVYFLSNGNVPINNVTLCDQVPANSTFLTSAFGANSGITFALGNTSPTALTNASDADQGQFFAPGTLAPGLCRIPPDPSQQLSAAENLDGAVGVNVVTGSATLPDAAPGSPAYGLIRFRVEVD